MIYALSRWITEVAKSGLENALKLRLTGNLLRKDYASVSATHTGEWLNRLTNDTSVVAGGTVDILPGFVGTAVRLIAALVMIILMDPWFGYIFIPGGAVMIGLTFVFRKPLKRLHKNIQESDGRLRTFLHEHISNLMVIKSYGAEEQTEADAFRKMEDHKSARMRRLRLSNLTGVGFSLAMQGRHGPLIIK